jgi:hypothetical protein
LSTQSIRLEAPLRAKWIISGREDLTWFIGSSLVSYAVLALMAAGFPLTPLYLIWLVGIDGPHVLATVTRTYFDVQERRRLGGLLWIVIPAMMMGPIMVAGKADTLFYVIANGWLHYHIAKQHFGFVMLYKHKAGDRDRFDFVLDRWFLLSSLMLPYARFMLYNFTRMPNLDRVLLPAYALLAAVFLARQVQKWRAGAVLNAPKLMLLAVVVPLQWLAFQQAGYSDGLLRAGVALGLFHSFQYHRLMWFHNQNRYTGAGEYGLAGTLARKFVYYFGAAALLNLALEVLPPRLMPNAYLSAALWGIPFTHYILDSKIWRVRGNKELAAALKL